MRGKYANVNVTIECPDILSVGIWRKFAFDNFKHKIKPYEDGFFLEITYSLTKLYDIDGKRSTDGVNYKYILYKYDDLLELKGYCYRIGTVKSGQTVKQELKLPLNEIFDNYRLVITEYTD